MSEILRFLFYNKAVMTPKCRKISIHFYMLIWSLSKKSTHIGYDIASLKALGCLHFKK